MPNYPNVDTLSELIRKQSFYNSGGEEPGTTTADRFNQGVKLIGGVGDIVSNTINNVLAIKKANLERQKLKADINEKLQGQTPMRDLTMPLNPQTMRIDENTTPEQRAEQDKIYAAREAMGTGTLDQAKEMSEIEKNLRERQLNPMKSGVHRFVDRKTGKILQEIPSTPGTGDTTTLIGEGSGGGDVTVASRLRQEFINRPEVKDFVTVNTSIKSMDSLLKNALQGNKQNQLALDQALITMFNKLTDPQSVVRESEYARTPENLPMVNRIAGALEKVGQGGAGMTNEDRLALVTGAKIIGNERGNTFNNLRNEYETLSTKYQIDPSLITGTLKPFNPYQYENEGQKELDKLRSQSSPEELNFIDSLQGTPDQKLAEIKRRMKQ